MKKLDIETYPLITSLQNYDPILWTNGLYRSTSVGGSISDDEINEAIQRMERFQPFIVKAFPETINGKIESPLLSLDKYKERMKLSGKWLLKGDHDLAIAGSIKARGGFFEILSFAEQLAIDKKLWSISNDYNDFDNDALKALFANYTIEVGSTGNLGLSIGIISSTIGFNVNVHMSSDAKEWKKNKLREHGVNVIEYNGNYTLAVKKGRALSNANPMSYFIDDENSKLLFLGYILGAYETKKQLDSLNVLVDKEHPLFVYLPCGVGGGPGGIAYGLKKIFGSNVCIFFAEPTHAPCMLLGMMTEQYEAISIEDIGLDGITSADGLAVGTASGFVGQLLKHQLRGIYTIDDSELFRHLYMLQEEEGLRLEPSALAGIIGPLMLRDAIDAPNVTHLSWSTGGSLVPPDEYKHYYKTGKQILEGETT